MLVLVAVVVAVVVVIVAVVVVWISFFDTRVRLGPLSLFFMFLCLNGYPRFWLLLVLPGSPSFRGSPVCAPGGRDV